MDGPFTIHPPCTPHPCLHFPYALPYRGGARRERERRGKGTSQARGVGGDQGSRKGRRPSRETHLPESSRKDEKEAKQRNASIKGQNPQGRMRRRPSRAIRPSGAECPSVGGGSRNRARGLGWAGQSRGLGMEIASLCVSSGLSGPTIGNRVKGYVLPWVLDTGIARKISRITNPQPIYRTRTSNPSQPYAASASSDMPCPSPHWPVPACLRSIALATRPPLPPLPSLPFPSLPHPLPSPSFPSPPLPSPPSLPPSLSSLPFPSSPLPSLPSPHPSHLTLPSLGYST